MDEQEQQNEVQEEQNDQMQPTPLSPPPSHKKLVIGIVAVFVLVVAGIAGAYFLLQPKAQPVDETISEAMTSKTAVEGSDFAPVEWKGYQIVTKVETKEKKREQFLKQLGELPEGTQEELAKQVIGIIAVKESLDALDAPQLVIETQPSGKVITVSQASLEKSGFVIIVDRGFGGKGGILGVSDLLQLGTHTDFKIILNKVVDRTELNAYIYTDNGDGFFDYDSDKRANRPDKPSFPILSYFYVETIRSETEYTAPPSTYAVTITMREQLSGNAVEVRSVWPLNSGFLVIYDEKNGLPGDIIGVSKYITAYGGSRAETQFRIPLQRQITDELLYAIYYRDNGDKKFDGAADQLEVLDANTLMAVKFPVLPETVSSKDKTVSDILSISVIAPNGDEELLLGEQYQMRWGIQNKPTTANWWVEGTVIPGIGKDFMIFRHKLEEDKGSYNWTVEGPANYARPTGIAYFFEVCIEHLANNNTPTERYCGKSDNRWFMTTP